MILKGRYTYARRGPAPEPFYPAMPSAESMTGYPASGPGGPLGSHAGSRASERGQWRKRMSR